MPGPLSMATSSTARAISGCGRSRTTPSTACLTRFETASLTATPTSPVRVASKPASLASSAAARRTAPTALGSSVRIHTSARPSITAPI